MAAITSAQTGNWSATGTWVGGVVPGDGDTVTIATGHIVTVDVNTTVGTAPTNNTTTVLGFTGTGSLVVATGATLTLKGNLTGGNGDITFNAGSSCVFAVDSTYRYQIEINAGNFACNGTSSSRVSFSKTGTGTCRILNLYTTVTKTFKFTYCDFTNIGGTTTAYSVRGVEKLEVTNCRFFSCGQLQFGAGSANLPFVVNNNHFEGGIGTSAFSLDCTTVGTGLREIKNNSTSTVATFSNLRGCTVSGNSFADIAFGSGLTYYATLWEYNFIYAKDNTINVPVVKNEYRYSAESDNMHLYLMSREVDQVYDSCICETGVGFTIDGHDGFIIAGASSSSLHTYTIKNCLILPGLDPSYASCTLFTCAVDSNAIFKVENNTFYARNPGFGFVGVHWNGVAGMVEYFKNNLGWDSSLHTNTSLMYELADSGDTPPTADGYVSYCDYNADFNLSADYDASANIFQNPVGTPYTPGVHDLTDADPRFVDKDRCLSKWASAVLGKSGTKTQLNEAAINALANMNNQDSVHYNANASVSALVEWVKAGFAPTNPVYKTASSTGSYIGAVEPVTLSGATSLMMMSF